MRRKNKSFYYIIKDHDQKLFNYFGPISSDNDWNGKVVDAQNTGRSLSVSSPWTEDDLNASIQYLTNQGYKKADFLLVNPPPDRSAEYSGNLPSYAEGADLNKVVIIHCHTCKADRYAEMEVKYPGQDSLRNTQLGTFTAYCLKCGEQVKDCYNWHR